VFQSVIADDKIDACRRQRQILTPSDNAIGASVGECSHGEDGRIFIHGDDYALKVICRETAAGGRYIQNTTS